jgi:hydrogenase maturation protease
LLCDDSAGIHVAEACRNLPECKNVTIVDGGLDGATLLALLTEYNRVIIVDAVQTGDKKAGYIFRVGPEVLNKALQPRITHGINLIAALELGKKLELKMPEEIIIFAIEAADITTMSEDCTPDVRKAVSACTKMIVRELS